MIYISEVTLSPDIALGVKKEFIYLLINYKRLLILLEVKGY